MLSDIELKDEILLSPSANRLVDYVTGIYDNSYVGLWLYQVIGMEVDDLEKWTKEVRQQLFPQTATWGLVLWEELYDLYPNSKASLSQRRQAILRKIQTRAPMNPEKIRKLAESIIDLPVVINERISRNRFEVVINGNQALYLWKSLRDVISEAKPAHLQFDIVKQILVESHNQIAIGAITGTTRKRTCYPAPYVSTRHCGTTLHTGAVIRTYRYRKYTPADTGGMSP